MRFIPISQGQGCISLSAASALADANGTWLNVDGLQVVSFEVVIGVDSGTITGTFYIEATTRLTGTVSAGSRILLPAGSLHTSLSTVALSTPVSATMGSTTVAMTAVGAGRFLVTVADLPSGMMRCVYDYASNSSAVNPTIVVNASGWG